MKTALILLLSCAGLSMAQTSEQTPSQPQQVAQVVKRLASVTWDLDTHKLVWVVQRGIEVDGKFQAVSTDRYEVSPEEGFMASNDEKRGLAEEDAGSVADLVNLLSLYCAQSTDWWESGPDADSGAEQTAAPKQDPKTNNAKPDKKAVPPSGEKPTRVGEPAAKPAMPRMPGTLIAENQPLGK